MERSNTTTSIASVYEAEDISNERVEKSLTKEGMGLAAGAVNLNFGSGAAQEFVSPSKRTSLRDRVSSISGAPKRLITRAVRRSTMTTVVDVDVDAKAALAEKAGVPPAPPLGSCAHLVPPKLTKHQSTLIKGKWKEEQASDAEYGHKFAAAVAAAGFREPRPDARKRPLPGVHPEFPYECLVFKGGGAKGAIYPGALKALEDAGVMPYIKRVAGASAGAVTAALIAIGLSAEQLYIELATVDLFRLVVDQGDKKLSQMSDLATKFGMNPGNALYKHLGTIFERYLGCADVTFQQLYDCYGVELAVAVTNISRAAVELLHVKTAPNYPIRKAIRMSMSLPVALRPCRDRNIHSVVSDRIVRLHREIRLKDEEAGSRPIDEEEQTPLEFYVDGGVLNNYPIDCFDGWWLSMDRQDNFFKKIIGTNGHKNYVERCLKHNAGTIGFRLASEAEPDAMHSRLGNDALELKVRSSPAAWLPSTPTSKTYAAQRDEHTSKARERHKLDKELRASMDWLRKLREEVAQASKAGKPLEPLGARLARAPPPAEMLSALGVETLDDMIDIMRRHHGNVARERSGSAASAAAAGVVSVSSSDASLAEVSSTRAGRTPTVAELLDVVERYPEAHDEVHELYARTDLEDDAKLQQIQLVVLRYSPMSVSAKADGATGSELPDLATACDEIEDLLEMMGESLMKRMGGMEPKEISSIAVFMNRLIEAIQMTNDERVQTKENYSRTCTLHTEYVGTMDFKLEEADNEFLWRKGYLSTKMWLEKRSEKNKEKRKKVAKGIAKTLMERMAKSMATSDAAAPVPVPVPPPPAPNPAPPSNEGEAEAAAKLRAMLPKLQTALQSTVMSDAEKVKVIQRLAEKAAAPPDAPP